MPVSGPRWRFVVAMLLLTLKAVAQPPSAHSYPELLWLDVELNEQPLGPALVTLPAPRQGLWLESAALQRWIGDFPGERVETVVDGTTYTALDPLPGVRYYVDRDAQILHLHLPATLFPVQLRGRAARESGPIERGLGGVLNYAVNGATSSSQPSGSEQSGAALFDALIFNRLGSLRQSWLMNSNLAGGGVRLDTTWVTDFPQNSLRLTLGDTVSTGDPFDTRVRLGGLQLRRAFETRPTEPAFPIPVFTGVAELPSTVELYVDNVRRAQFDLEPGPYEITNPPIVTGAGTAQLVLTDVLGNTVVTALPFFVDPGLLRSGLTDFSVDLGYTRNGYASGQSSYDDPIGVGFVRYGMTDTLTIGARSSWRSSLRSADLSATWQPGRQIPLLLSANAGAYRDSSALQGTLGQFQLSLRPRNWRAALQVTRTDPGGHTQSTELPFRSRELAQVGARWGRWSTDLSGLTRESGDGGRFSSVSFRVGFSPRGYFTGVISAEIFRTIDHEQDLQDTGVRLFLSWTPRPTTSLTTSVGTGRTPFQAVQLNERTLDEIGANYDIGITRTDDTARGYGLATVRLSRVELDARIERLSRDREVFALGARGAVGAVNGRVFSGRQLRSSFAVVDLNGLSGVPVYRENRLAGLSDRRGLVMIPDLLEYQTNRLSIDLSQLPLDVQPGDPLIEVTPGHLTGIPVDFELRRVRQGTLRLRTSGDRAVPSGAQLTVNGELAHQPVGDGGLVYLDNLRVGDNRVVAEWTRGRCELSVYYPESIDPLPDLGIRYCKPL